MADTAVNEQSAAVELMMPDWRLAAALLGGTRTMREAANTYLPKFANETTDAYTNRLGVSVLFPAYARTIQTLTGKPFSKPITLGEDIPTQILPMLEDVDLQGRNLDAFASSVFYDALGFGIAGILVDYPRASPGVRTLADERMLGLRPYWVQVKPQQILGWRAAREGGSWQLKQLRLHEMVEVEDGMFGVEMVEQVRVLEPGVWTTYRSTGEKGAWEIYDQGLTTLDYIPFVPVYGGRTAFMNARPPLIEVAYLNVAHWQSSSDQQNILHVARVPMLAISGVNDDKFTLTVGSSSAIKLPEGGKLEFVEHSGSAVEAGSAELVALEERMRQAGAELIVVPKYVATATQILTENAVGMSVLQRITQDYEDALDQALQITADWLGLPDGGHVSLFNDYGASTLQEASAQLLLSSNQAGKISDETLYSEYQRRGIVSADLSWEEEQGRIESQGPALGEMTSPSVPTVMPSNTNQEPAAQAMDMEALGDKLADAISNITFAAPNITVESPVITVNVPTQEPPVVNVSPADITVNPPNVNVTVQKGGEIKFTEDDEGKITGATVQ
jgi:hypothetical protein